MYKPPIYILKKIYLKKIKRRCKTSIAAIIGRGRLHYDESESRAGYLQKCQELSEISSAEQSMIEVIDRATILCYTCIIEMGRSHWSSCPTPALRNNRRERRSRVESRRSFSIIGYGLC